MTTLIPRGDAVQRIADYMADRDAFLVIAPPGRGGELANQLREIPDWTGYADCGTELALRTDQAASLIVVDMITMSTIIVAIPKTVPAATLGAALGQDIPADGSKDLVLIRDTETGPIRVPLLLIDAMELVEPAAAAQLRANDVTRLS